MAATMRDMQRPSSKQILQQSSSSPSLSRLTLQKLGAHQQQRPSSSTTRAWKATSDSYLDCRNGSFVGSHASELRLDLEEVDTIQHEAPTVSSRTNFQVFSSLFDIHAAPILQFLKVQDIVGLHLASPDCYAFCRSPRSHKLLVPTLFLKRLWIPKVELANVEALYADDAQLITFLQNDEFAGWLAACASLRELYCSHNQKIMIQALARGLANLQQLVVLDLAHNSLGVDGRFQREQPLDQIFTALPPFLRILDLSYNSLKDSHALRLVEILESKCVAKGGLEQLRLRSNYLGNSAGVAFGHLLRIPAGTKLRCLDMRTNRMEEEGACAMLLALREHPRMQEMRVGYNRQNSKQDLETAQLARIVLQRALGFKSCLKMLDLNNVCIGDEGMKRVSNALAQNTTLTRLDIAFNGIGPEGAQALATALEHNTHIQHLDIRDNEIGDVGAQRLAVGLAQNQSLRKLLLARNELTPQGGLSLMAAIRGNERLHIDFGASGSNMSRLQGVMSRNPTMADYRFMRDVEREMPPAEDSQNLVSLMFSV